MSDSCTDCAAMESAIHRDEEHARQRAAKRRPTAPQMRFLIHLRDHGPQVGTPVGFDPRTPNACEAAGWVETVFPWGNGERPVMARWVLTDAGRVHTARREG